MADNYLELDQTSGRLKQKAGTVTSAGSSQAGKLVALDSSGKLDMSLMPSGVGGETNVQSVVATEALNAGDWVNIYNNGGTAACRKALAQDATKPAQGFVTASVSSGNLAGVNLGGVNSFYPVAGFANPSCRILLSGRAAQAAQPAHLYTFFCS